MSAITTDATVSETKKVSGAARWTGWIMSAVPVLMLLLSAVMKFAKPAPVVQGFEHLGISINLAMGLGILELACTLVYLVPRASVLGAILLTGYLGGATLATLRVGDFFLPPAILGVFVWGGLYLRDPRLRALIPLRR
jgi:hypothetical protein